MYNILLLPCTLQKLPVGWPSGHIECPRVNDQVTTHLGIDLTNLCKSQVITNG